jgi:hypothetical protein
MKSLYQLHAVVLEDLGRQCSIGIARDLKTVARRYEDEGDSFLTITLPLFAKALERGLETGQWPDRGELPNWKYVRGLPAFMRGFTIRVFDEDGRTLQHPDPDSIRAVRQFCLLSQKIERECSPDRIRKAFTSFVETDRELIGLPGRLDPDRLRTFVRVAEKFFGTMFSHCEKVIAEYGLVPKHGPGAVAERKSQKEKRVYDYWVERLETSFPAWRYTQNTGYVSPEPIIPSSEIPVRVVAVPKTQSTPRIIAIEPTVMQYAQQGLKREIYEWVGRGPLRKVLGFHDQTRNQKMAKEASSKQNLATLDLSEASDRVHWFLIYKMLARYPHLWDFVWQSRSSRADVHGFGVIPIQKFASMGSALTFPLETIVFTTLAICGVRSVQPSIKITPRHLAGSISVYGDDIIVPVDTVDAVIDWLEHFGAKVNQRKSFWNGKFRESCGAEYYDGHDVTIARLRAEVPTSRHDAANLAAYIDFRNRMYLSGMWGVVKVLDEELESLIKLPYVYASVAPQAGFLHLVTSTRPTASGERFNPNLHHHEIKVPVLSSHGSVYRIDGEAGLLEWFHSSLRRGDLVDRYDSEERATSFSIQRRWMPTYFLGGSRD